MGRTLVRTMKIDYKTLTISMTAASSNVRDWNDRLIYESNTTTHDTLDTFKRQVFAIANDILSGMIQVPRNHTMEKRLQYLKEHGLLEPESDTSPDWFHVVQNEESFNVLSGKTRVKCPMYIIANANDRGVVSNKFSCQLKSKNKATKFLDKNQAQALCDSLEKSNNWVSAFGLYVQEVN